MLHNCHIYGGGYNGRRYRKEKLYDFRLSLFGINPNHSYIHMGAGQLAVVNNQNLNC